MSQTLKLVGVVVLMAAAYLAGTATPRAESQSTVVNQDQRTIRALESQAQSLKSIASSLKRLEKCP